MKLSVITICYNDREGLQRTLESVRAQTCRSFQYVVIDGASTDGSADLLAAYKDIISYGVSEPDKGIYNAMNKGIRMAEGEYCLFLNAGDTFHAADTVEKALPLLDGTDFLSGHTLCVFPDGHSTTWRGVNEVTTYLMSIYSLSHQATFIRTKLLKERPYREDLRIVSDWEQMFYEMVIRDASYKPLPIYICRFAQGGVSSANAERRETERKKVLDENFSQRMQHDLVHPNLLVRIATLADPGTRFYQVLEFAARLIRRLFR